MKAKIVGKKAVAYQSKKTGKDVKGISLYLLREPTSRETDVQGLVADSVFISEGTVSIPTIDFGKQYELNYEFDGRFSYLSSIVPVA